MLLEKSFFKTLYSLWVRHFNIYDDLALHTAGRFPDPHDLALHIAGRFHDPHDMALRTAGRFYDPHDVVLHTAGRFHEQKTSKTPIVTS